MQSLLSPIMLLTILACPAYADLGALTTEVQAGFGGIRSHSPHLLQNSAIMSYTPAFSAAVRYALTNELELVGTGFYEPSVDVWHNRSIILTSGGELPGTLKYSTSRFGALAGARYMQGMVWRIVLALDVGISIRQFSGFQAVDDSRADNPLDYGLQLPGQQLMNFVISPGLGIEWAAGDHWSIGLLPRLQILAGRANTVSVVLPVAFAWSWYI